MKNLIIIGAGGMGRNLYDLTIDSRGYNEEFCVKGFIDDDLTALNDFSNYPPLLGSIKNYMPQENDCFVCSIGGTFRKLCMENIIKHNAEFVNIIHNTARIGTNVRLGKGNIVGAYSCIGSDAIVGNYNMIQSYSIIGHDATIGDWNRIDTHVTCVGGVKIGNQITIHTSAVISHSVIVEDDSCVGACSFVIKKVKSGTTVIGNPAKKLYKY